MHKSKILIVDDSEKSRTILSKYVKHMGYEAVTISSGFEAVNYIKTTPPDIILLDIMLPDIDGLEILSIIKSDPQTFTIPTVMITGLSNEEYRIKAKELGADDFIIKPFSYQEIRGRIFSIMKVRELHAELEFAQNAISTLTNYQESILSNFDSRAFDMDKILNMILEKLLYESYRESGPEQIIILFDNGTGSWVGKYYSLGEGKKSSKYVSFLKTEAEDTDMVEDSIKIMKTPHESIFIKGGNKSEKESEGGEEGLERRDSIQVGSGEEGLNHLPEFIHQSFQQIKNYIRYKTPKMMVVAANFEKELTEIDGQIFKSLFVSLSALKTISDRISDIEAAFHYTIETLSRVAEINDKDTYNHIRRINRYSSIIAEKLKMEGEFIHDISFMAQMHDVGKIQVAPAILNKKGTLTEKEFEKIKLHTIYGAKIIGDNPRLKMAKEIALSHHERWDGSGYPFKLSGEVIPISARIVSIVDVYDALRSARPYKSPLSHEEAIRIIAHGDKRTLPSYFDPEIMDVFLKHHRRLDEVFKEYKPENGRE